jgi:hypothetical protein
MHSGRSVKQAQARAASITLARWRYNITQAGRAMLDRLRDDNPEDES